MPETQLYKEAKILHPRIRFETASHTMFDQIFDEIDERLINGDLRAHVWNREIVQRLKEYSSDEMTIDGLVPLVDWTGKTGPTDLAYARRLIVWRNLPDRPKELNKNGEVLVTVGDIGYGYSGNLSKGFDQAEDQANINLVESYINYHLKQEHHTNIPRLISGEIGIFAAMPAAYLFLGALHKSLEGRVTRRDLFKTAAKGIAAMGIASAGRFGLLSTPQLNAAYSRKKSDHDFWQAVARVTGPLFFKSEWAITRVALLVAKSEDTLDHIGKPDGVASLIMGFSHAPEAARVIEDKDYRNEVIRRYVAGLLKIIDLSFEGNSRFPKSLINPVKKNLQAAIAQIDLIRVTDPGGPDKVQDMRSFINNNVQLLESFQSPRIQKALESL